jgi:hypothetical protein
MIIQQKQQADILDFSCNGKIKYGVYAYFLHSFRKINEVKQIPKKPHPLYEQNFPKKKKKTKKKETIRPIEFSSLTLREILEHQISKDVKHASFYR